MNLTQRRNALVGAMVIAIARRSMQQRFGGRSSTLPYFVLGLVAVFAVVVWRRRLAQPTLVDSEI